MITVDGKKRPWQQGMTVAQLLAETDHGEMYAVVRLNGKLISRPNFTETHVPDAAEVILLPMIAGG